MNQTTTGSQSMNFIFFFLFFSQSATNQSDLNEKEKEKKNELREREYSLGTRCVAGKRLKERALQTVCEGYVRPECVCALQGRERERGKETTKEREDGTVDDD